MTTYGIVAALLLAQASPTPTPTAAPEAARVLALDDALREAQARNLDLQATRARLDQSRELHWKAWSAYLPQVTAGGTYTHNNVGVNLDLPAFTTIRTRTGPAGSVPGEPAADPASNPVTGGTIPGDPANGAGQPFLFNQNVTVEVQRQNQLAAQLQATQAIFAPQAWFGIAAARAGERAAAESAESVRRDVLFGVAQTYYGAVGLKQVVTIQERQLAISLEHEKDARIRYDAGTAPKVTLLRAEIDRARAEQDLKRAQNSLVSAKLAVAALLDRKEADFDVAVPVSPQPPAGPPAALEEAAARDRPDVRATYEQLTVAERNRSAVLTRYLPTLGAFGRYQWTNASGFSGENTSWAIGLALNWTLLDGFLRESDLRENAARVREAEASQAAALVRARTEVQQARLDLDSAVANREKAKEQLALARENQRLVDVNYKAGAATYIEVSDANTALLTAELTQVSESLNADLAALRLLKAAGAFDPR